jgi:hypothetical protein
MTWFSRAKNRINSDSQPLGFYVNLPSLPRLVLLIFVILPLFFGFWYLWAQLLGFWMANVDTVVEPGSAQAQVNVTEAPAFDTTLALNITLALTTTKTTTLATSTTPETTLATTPTPETTTQQVTKVATTQGPKTTTFVRQV